MINKRQKKKKKIWFQTNEDAKGYQPDDNRAIATLTRREVVRRTFNF